MSNVDLIIESAKTFYNQLGNDQNCRYRSWEYCYKVFHDARNKDSKPDSDYLSLQLAFYLASWGMYRGSSFLLQKDYKIHSPIVEEILQDKYDPLFGIECVKLREEQNWQLLEELQRNIISHYKSVRKSVISHYKSVRISVRGADVEKGILSSTLITKVLMGTLGCVPAYDRYFTAGVKDQSVATGTYNQKSIMQLVDFYEENKDRLESIRSTLKVDDLPYPQMKLLDMGFWQVGFERERARRKTIIF